MKLFEMKHIKKEFGGMPVIRDISLSVEQGEILAIIGPSGSGAAEDLPGDHGAACQGVFRIHPDLFP